MSLPKGDIWTKACSPLCRLITNLKRQKREPYTVPSENYLPPPSCFGLDNPLHWTWCPPSGDNDNHYLLWEKIVKSTNNKILQFICKSIQSLVSFWQIQWSICWKMFHHHTLRLFSSKSFFYLRKWKPNYLITLHFGNTLYNYLHAIVKKTISHRNQMCWYTQDQM